MWETQVRSLIREDHLQKEMATHSSILAWRIPWTEELGRLQSTGSQRVGHDWVTSLSLSLCSLHHFLVLSFLWTALILCVCVSNYYLSDFVFTICLGLVFCSLIYFGFLFVCLFLCLFSFSQILKQLVKSWLLDQRSSLSHGSVSIESSNLDCQRSTNSREC